MKKDRWRRTFGIVECELCCTNFRSVQLVEAEVTDDLNDYMEMISGAVNYVNQTFSLFEAAEAQRPAKLVNPIKRDKD